jgi:YVTN family beta-propeller protein
MLIWQRTILYTLAVALMQKTDPRIDLQRGIDLMENRGDCKAAIAVFSTLAEADNRSVRARALLFLGQCHSKLGNDPRPFYTRLVREFQDEQAVASQAAEALKELTRADPAQHASPEVRQGARMPVVINRLRTGIEPFEAVMAFEGKQVWVTNLGDSSISVIETASNQVVETIPVRGVPLRTLASVDGTKVYLAFEKGGVEMIDVVSRSRAVFDTGSEVVDMEVSSDGKVLYLAMGRAGVSKLLLTPGRIEPVLETPCAQGLTLSPDGRHLWVNYDCGGPGGRPGHSAVAQFDAASGRLTKTNTNLPNVGGWIQLSPEGKFLIGFAGDACSHPIYDHDGCEKIGVNTVNVLDSNTLNKARTLVFSRGGGPVRPFYSLAGRNLVIAQIGDALSLLDYPDFALVGSIPFHGTGSLAFTPDGTTAYAPIPSEDVVAVLWFGKS